MKKLILAAVVLVAAGMSIESAKAGVALSINLGGGSFIAVRTPAYCPPAPVYCPPPVAYCPPAPCRPVCAPPVVIVRPRPVCVTSPGFVAVRHWDRDNRWDDRRDDRRDNRYDNRFDRGYRHHR